MEDSSHLIWGTLFGAIGLGFFTYGTRQRAIVPLCTAVALFIFPYFIENIYALVFTGITLVILPYFVRL